MKGDGVLSVIDLAESGHACRDIGQSNAIVTVDDVRPVSAGGRCVCAPRPLPVRSPEHHSTTNLL
eukprot:107145-Prorocentrum_minimum.AAC.2